MMTFQQVDLARQQLSEAEATRAAWQMTETWEKGDSFGPGRFAGLF